MSQPILTERTTITMDRAMNRVTATLVSAAVLGALVACAAPEGPSLATGTTTPSPTETEVLDGTDYGPEPTPLPAGTAAEVNTWTITITGADLDAADTIADINPYNEPPRGQYVLVTYQAVYTGPGSADADLDLTWLFVGTDQVLYDEAGIVTPADDGAQPTLVRTGGTVTSDVAFDVPADALDGAFVNVQSYDDEQATFVGYADLALP